MPELTEVELGSMPLKIVDMTSAAMTGVTFAGPCIATGTIEAGRDKTPEGWRLTSILTASIGGQTAGICGCVDYEDNVGHLSAGPASLTLAVPSGHHGKFVVTGGNPKALLITLVKLES